MPYITFTNPVRPKFILLYVYSSSALKYVHSSFWDANHCFKCYNFPLMNKDTISRKYSPLNFTQVPTLKSVYIEMQYPKSKSILTIFMTKGINK